MAREALCSNDDDCPGAREIREAIHDSDKGKLLGECECRSDAVVVVRVEREIGWCRLLDCGRDRGPKCALLCSEHLYGLSHIQTTVVRNVM